MPVRPTPVFRHIEVSAAGEHEIWDPAEGKRFRLLSYMIYSANPEKDNAFGGEYIRVGVA